MRILISEQCLYFLYSILLGALIALFYEPLRFLRVLFCHKTPLIAVEDFLYCIFSAICFLFLTYALSYGEIRWFGVLGTLSGALLYRFTLGRLIRRCTEKLAIALKRVKRVLDKRVFRPIASALQRSIARRKSRRAIRLDHSIQKRLLKLSKRGF